jgi:predicted transcriptional regulator
MPGDQQAFEDIQFLTGSPQRREVLAALCDEPARPAELCRDIDATRTTIQRILAGFRERQWVSKHDGCYRATFTGQQVRTQYEALLTAAERAREFGPLAAHLCPVANDLPVEAIERGSLTVSEDGSPLAALSRFTDWMAAIEGRLLAVSPVVARPFNEIGVELLESGTEIGMVIDETVLERSREQYESDLQLGVTHDAIDVYVQDDPLPVGVALDTERVCLIAYDEHNNMRALLESRDEELYEWGLDTYERHRERAAPLEAVYDREGVSAPEGGR